MNNRIRLIALMSSFFGMMGAEATQQDPKLEIAYTTEITLPKYDGQGEDRQPHLWIENHEDLTLTRNKVLSCAGKVKTFIKQNDPLSTKVSIINEQEDQARKNIGFLRWVQGFFVPTTMHIQANQIAWKTEQTATYSTHTDPVNKFPNYTQHINQRMQKELELPKGDFVLSSVYTISNDKHIFYYGNNNKLVKVTTQPAGTFRRNVLIGTAAAVGLIGAGSAYCYSALGSQSVKQAK